MVAKDTVRIEIQLLRAAAVAAVILFHLWPARVPGGYVGVDVFFVISGFLITSQLARSLEDRTFRFGPFYARRARRILPAALLVLLATSVAVIAVTGLANWPNFFREIVASTLFVENWVLAADSVDYLARENAASPVQHYWSLSAEEQFYLVWPLLLWATVALSRGRGRDSTRRRLLIGAIGTVLVLSFVTSIVLTALDPAPAYFSLATRMWEFAAGGLLAVLLVHRPAPTGAARVLLLGAGWIGIAASVLLLSDTVGFPGWIAALPVGATLLVIGSGPLREVRIPGPILRPVLVVAEISFALYLWHWPLIVFAESVVPGPLQWTHKVAILAATGVLAWLTTRFVETPLRRHRLADLPARRVLATSGVAIAATALIAAALLGASVRFTTTLAAAQGAPPDPRSGCFGASASDPALDCASVVFDSLTPNPIVAVDDKPAVYARSCWDKTADVITCHLGAPLGTGRVALLGDSHAIAISPTVDVIARKFDWSVDTYFKSGCPFFSAASGRPDTADDRTCIEWNAALVEQLASTEPYDVAIVTYSDGTAFVGDRESAIAGFREVWRPLIERGTLVVVVRDFPGVGDWVECLSESPRQPERCAVARAEFEKTDFEVAAAEGMSGVLTVDLTDVLCDDDTCQVALGGVTVFRDSHHLTNTFALSLAPILETRLVQAGVVERVDATTDG